MTSSLQFIPTVLTIAGSDSGGGAGIQADIKAFTALKCYGASVITALTAQNTVGVQDVHPCPPPFVEQQLSSVLDDLDIKAIKTGMLYDANIIRATAQKLRVHYHDMLPPVVCDPVFVSTSGHTLLAPEAMQVLIDELIPLATVITPNKQEAELLLSRTGSISSINTVEEMLLASANLALLCSKAVLLKGGHIKTTLADIERLSTSDPQVLIIKNGLLDENMEILQFHGPESSPELVVDVLQQPSADEHGHMTTTLFVRPRIDSTSTHGTGCTLSAAIACGLANNLPLLEAVKSATIYTHLGIETAFPVGKGHGPLNHLHSTIPRIVSQPTPKNRYPLTQQLIKSCSSIWKSYVEHPFVQEVGKGILDKRRFIHFIKQDYHYLKYYARAYALLATKSSTFTPIELSMRTVENVLYEIAAFSGRWGVTKEELENTPESITTTAYGAFIMDVGAQGDSAKLTVALAACLLGYGEVGLWLIRESKRSETWVLMDKESNPYVPWIEVYSGERYQEAVRIGLDVIEKIAEADPPSQNRYEEWKVVWERCVTLEKGFWDMAMTLS